MMKLPKELTTVTPLSKYLAMVVFIALPLVGFFLGIRYQEMVDLAKRQQMEPNLSIPQTATPTPLPAETSVKEGDETANWKTYRNEKYKNMGLKQNIILNQIQARRLGMKRLVNLPIYC